MKNFYNAKVSTVEHESKSVSCFMRKVLLSGLLVLALVFCHNIVLAESSDKATTGIKVAFGNKCEKLLISEIDKSKKTVHVAIYSITRRNITKALASAVRRGVKVEVKYDYKSSDWPGMKDAIAFMKKNKIKCKAIKLKGNYAKMHHKFTIIDAERVLTGSYNYTTSATESSYENMVLIDNTEVAESFLKEYNAIKSK